jgi:hypothetical protein
LALHELAAVAQTPPTLWRVPPQRNNTVSLSSRVLIREVRDQFRRTRAVIVCLSRGLPPALARSLTPWRRRKRIGRRGGHPWRRL